MTTFFSNSFRALFSAGLVTLSLAPQVGAQQTAAERSSYEKTSSWSDVMGFLGELERETGDIRVGTLAVSVEGRTVPWVLAARPMVDGPVAARMGGKPVVYLQGNIHAGEVEGKEAAQMLLRDLTVGPLHSLLDSVVLLVVPIYNPDGNDAFGPGDENRSEQNGPPVVGLRPNGQGLDLNRDYVKMEAPETRGAARLINRWDPDLFVDLHTTDGSYHGYALTFSPGLNPNLSEAGRFVRDHFLPTVRRRMKNRHGREIFPYGNFRNQNPDSLNQGWYTYDPRPRYGTNWFGLRGRMGILSEAYSHAPFAERVAATYDFVHEILSLAAEEADSLRALHRSADAWRPDSVAVAARRAPPVTRDVVAEITLPAEDGAGPFARRRQTGEFRTVSMPVYDRFEPAHLEPRPAAYLLPPRLGPVVELLLRQGVRVRRLTEEWQGPVEWFAVDSVRAAGRVFQGHRIVSLTGRWRTADRTAEAGWYLVATDQRLGVLAAYLLEPAAHDGVVAWNFLDRDLAAGKPYPILRVRGPVLVESVLQEDE